MAYRIQVDGMNELIQKMGKLPEKARDVASLALYEGAGVVADAVSQAVRGIATEPFYYAQGGRKRKASPEEKAILESAKKGVAKFRKSVDGVQTSVGMQNAGYATLNGKTKPIPQIVNAINSGTSFMQKQPFVRKAANSGAKKAEAAITKTIEQKFDEILKK